MPDALVPVATGRATAALAVGVMMAALRLHRKALRFVLDTDRRREQPVEPGEVVPGLRADVVLWQPSATMRSSGSVRSTRSRSLARRSSSCPASRYHRDEIEGLSHGDVRRRPDAAPYG
jgi:hypothetical protein